MLPLFVRVMFSRHFPRVGGVLLVLSIWGLSACRASSPTTAGLTRDTIRFGSVLALQGYAEGLGNGMKAGLQAAFDGASVRGRSIDLMFVNDYYEPPTALQATREIVDDDIFLAIGNVGTPTAKVTLPLLTEQEIPAVGFFTGAEFLRDSDAPIVNYRASYTQEIAATIEMGLDAGLLPNQVCAYVQNDSYGMAGLTGVRRSLENTQLAPETLQLYDRIIQMEGDSPDRNNIGPVGVYTRNTPIVEDGYYSLKSWERETGNACKLVVTAGTYGNIARFAKQAQEQGEDWIISAVSFTGADDFQFDLEEYGVAEKIVMTQVVPLLDANLPIVNEAREILGDRLGFVELEGYIVGKMTLKILDNIEGELTRDAFVQQVRTSKFDLGGIEIDFTDDGNQGSDLVVVTYLSPSGYRELDRAALQTMLGIAEVESS